jgi:hypothetical protein
MPFIGNQPALSYTSFAKQDFTTSATTSYTLDNPVANANELALFINFVRQEPTTAYSASGTSLTLTSATSATDDMYCVYLGKAVQTVNPPNASVGISQLTATGTKDATTFLRGDNTFASAGLSGWSEDGANNNLLPASASAGIYLGVSSATAANLLDDYEEGTFTPTFTSTSASFSYSQQHGFYTKIGRSVTCHIFIRGQSSGTTSNALKITNLPFTSINAGLFFASPTFGQIESIDYPTGALEITGNVPGNATQIDLQYSRDNAGSLSLLASAIDGATSNGFMVSINYFTD